MNYEQFINSKSQLGGMSGFKPSFMPDCLFDFQKAITEWAVMKGKAAIFADCGLGKTLMQLVWAENVVRETNGRVLILAPLAVGPQTEKEAHKFGIEAKHVRTAALPVEKIIITNYEKLHLFDANDFVGCVCDESSILKHFTGATQKEVTRFMLKLKYRLLCTATAAPNDYIELGTSSEALGDIGYSDMLTRFFRQTDNKPHRRQEIKEWVNEKHGNHFGKLAFRVSQQIGNWKLKGHAVVPFWRWIATWAKACRRPSDVGFSDDGFILPPLEERHYVVEPNKPAEGHLFVLDAFGLKEEREERRRTLDERCGLVADLVKAPEPAVIWCQLNDEGKRLAKIIPNSREVSGATSDDEKEEIVEWFLQGGDRKLISKAKIFGFGLNLQHCSHVVTFATHSYEQYYQSIRRCWRFGQKLPVTVDIVSTTGETRVRDNMERKARAMDEMFTQLVAEMRSATMINTTTDTLNPTKPAWL
jgi:hypothetical protein